MRALAVFAQTKTHEKSVSSLVVWHVVASMTYRPPRRCKMAAHADSFHRPLAQYHESKWVARLPPQRSCVRCEPTRLSPKTLACAHAGPHKAASSCFPRLDSADLSTKARRTDNCKPGHMPMLRGAHRQFHLGGSPVS